MSSQNPLEKFSNWMKNSITVRLLTIGFLILILLIPISFINDIISERKYRKEEVVREISATWGEAQTISGPVITIPYKVKTKTYNDALKTYEVSTFREYAHFLPENLEIKSVVSPEIKYRNIYEAIVYSADIEISGHFNLPNKDKLNIESELLFEQAFLTAGLTDLRNIEGVQLQFGGKEYSFETGLECKQVIASGISTKN